MCFLSLCFDEYGNLSLYQNKLPEFIWKKFNLHLKIKGDSISKYYHFQIVYLKSFMIVEIFQLYCMVTNKFMRLNIFMSLDDVTETDVRHYSKGFPGAAAASRVILLISKEYKAKDYFWRHTC